MNEKDTKRKTSSKKNGFYFALYSGIGVMLMIAIVLGYSNLNKSAEEVTPIRNPASISRNSEKAAEVNRGNDDHLEKDGQIGTAISGEANDSIVIAKKPAATQIPAIKATPRPSAISAPKPAAAPPPAPTEAIKKQDKEETSEIDIKEDETAAEKENGKAQLEVIDVDENNSKESDFAAYDDTKKMEWPVVGEIVMPFSTDTLVYDKTLEQYRTNESICISVPSGTQVKASADGIVSDVFKTKELGNTVVINHGNGWVTTYSQLQDNILVSVDDVVKAGQVLGGVGEPSMYSVLLGNHLNFEVLKDDIPVNPDQVMASN